MSIISLSYPDELKAQLQAKAKKDGRSLSNYICKVLYNHLDEEQPELKKSGPKPKVKSSKKRTKKTKKAKK